MRFLAIYIVTFVLVLVPQTVAAQEFKQLVGIPGLNPDNLSTAGYINALYILSISVAAFLAVARIILAGVQYVLTDIVPAKDAARKQITGALLGLLIVISAVLVLETINPQLTNFAALDQLPKREFSAQGSIDIILEEIDETGAVNLDGLSAEEKTAAIAKKRDGCADKKVIVSAITVSCDNSGVTSGTVNSQERFLRLVGEDDSVSISTYNQFISSVEPESVSTTDIEKIVADEGGSDYLFVVKNFSASTKDNEKNFRAQQKTFCEDRKNGLLFDSGEISVCILE